MKTTTLAVGGSDECPSQIKYGLHTLKSYYHGYFTPFKIAIELTLCFAEFTTVGSSKRNMIRYYRICLWGNVHSYVSSESFSHRLIMLTFLLLKVSSSAVGHYKDLYSCDGIVVLVFILSL